MNEKDGARIEALEVRSAHQEKLIADLNDVVAAQWRKIDALQKQLALLRETFEAVDFGKTIDPPPPHY
ncbi:MAG: SlyX family protein [Hyphomicrobiales bacterium]|nr:SlyX family protein [Hyphomicrobiales bacterium]